MRVKDHFPRARAGSVSGTDTDPSALLLAGWLSSRIGSYVPVIKTPDASIASVTLMFAGGSTITALQEGSRLILRREGTPDSIAPSLTPA